MEHQEEDNYAIVPNPGHVLGGIDDLIREILIRMPVYSLRDMRLMSRRWRAIVADRNFQDKHPTLKLPLKYASGIYIEDESGMIETRSLLDHLVPDLNFIRGVNRTLELVNSSNGFILLQTDSVYIVCNPSIADYIKVQSPAVGAVYPHTFLKFDPCVDGAFYLYGWSGNKVGIYNSNRRNWYNIDFTEFENRKIIEFMFTQGNIYWRGNFYFADVVEPAIYSIACDFKKTSLLEHPFPPSRTDRIPIGKILRYFGESCNRLIVIYCRRTPDSPTLDIWECDSLQQWTLIHSFNLSAVQSFFPEIEVEGEDGYSSFNYDIVYAFFEHNQTLPTLLLNINNILITFCTSTLECREVGSGIINMVPFIGSFARINPRIDVERDEKKLNKMKTGKDGSSEANSLEVRRKAKHKKSSKDKRKRRRKCYSSDSDSSSDSETESSESDSDSDSDSDTSSSDVSSSSEDRCKKRKRHSKRDRYKRGKRKDKCRDRKRRRRDKKSKCKSKRSRSPTPRRPKSMSISPIRSLTPKRIVKQISLSPPTRRRESLSESPMSSRSPVRSPSQSPIRTGPRRSITRSPPPPRRSSPLPRRSVSRSPVRSSRRSTNRGSGRAANRSVSRSPFRVPGRNSRRSYSRSPVCGWVRSPVAERGGRSVSSSRSADGSPKRIRRGRGFSQRFSYARRYHSPERSPVRSYRFGSRSERDRYSSHRRSPRHHRSPARERSHPRYRSRRSRTRSAIVSRYSSYRRSPRRHRSPARDRTSPRSPSRSLIRTRPRRSITRSPPPRRSLPLPRRSVSRSPVRSSRRSTNRSSGRASNRSVSRSPFRVPGRNSRRSYSRSPGCGWVRSPVAERGGRSVSSSRSADGSPKRIRRGRGFSQRFSYARRYHSPERSPVRSYCFGSRSERDRYSRYRRSPRRHRSPARERTPPRYRSRRSRTRSPSVSRSPIRYRNRHFSRSCSPIETATTRHRSSPRLDRKRSPPPSRSVSRSSSLSRSPKRAASKDKSRSPSASPLPPNKGLVSYDEDNSPDSPGR